MKSNVLFSIMIACCAHACAQEEAAQEFANKASAAQLKELQADLTEVIAKTNRSLTEKEREIVQAYYKAKPFPNQHKKLLGIWHGKSEDADFKSYWTYQRRADGTMRSKGIDLMPADREYADIGFDIVWRTNGRVIFERKASEPDQVDIYLIESLDR